MSAIMANPRKFSEKIALHTHRQAEETARFEQIMKEVSDATARPNEEQTQPRTVTYRAGSRARSQGGPIRRPHDRRLDTSPYSSGSFLSPPPDTSWRRTNSDSALHQSAMQGMNSDRGMDGSVRGWISPTMNGPDRNDGRPRSSCEVPRVPGINICPSAHEPGMIQIPICGNNTGSLPDLTNVDFSSPIHAPIDQDHDVSSPYSSSPVNTSPSTLSPTSITQGVRPHGRFHFTPVSSHAHSNHLSVPVNSRFHRQPIKNVPLDKNIVLDGSDFTHINNMTGMYQQQHSPTSPSPTLQQAAAYRSPRPSPQSSPSLGGRHSAPCSPGAPSPLPNDYTNIFNQQTNFHQQFDQLSMLDQPVNNISYVDPSTAESMIHPQSLPEVSTIGNIELTSDPGYYSTSPSQMVFPCVSPSLHTPNTPNTPTSIPNIILTTVDDVSRGDLTTQLENDIFEESLRAGLGPLDFDGMQMLANPGITLPDSVEDHFRLDRS